MPLRKQRENNLLRGRASSSEQDLRMVAGIQSGPVALLVSSFLSARQTVGIRKCI